ncbi:hypothetical protein AB0H00_23605 [Nocardia sp. NPDC023852]|uniref:hypothetical protein n=1 Tax=Nocardia sp. NPDC023852 TaxID=3154697 RepID=UPI0033DF30F8
MQASQDPDSLTAGLAGPGGVDASAELSERMMELIGKKARATTVFGEPITADGITIVPVARAGFGFGGGGGGAGGGIDVRPLGYIEIRHGVARYHPIRDLRGHVIVPLAAIAAGLAAPWIIRSVMKFRRTRHR